MTRAVDSAVEEIEAPVVVVGLADPDDRAVLEVGFDLAARLHGRLESMRVDAVPAPSAAVVVPAAGDPAVRPAADESSDWVADMCAQAAADVAPDTVDWIARHGSGDAGGALADLALEVGAYCVVVGSRGDGPVAGLGRLFRPSVSRAVLRERVVPVVVVPSNLDGPHTDTR
ncbi:MAG: universal stress protein [Sporichthyaceae bacterium]